VLETISAQKMPFGASCNTPMLRIFNPPAQQFLIVQAIIAVSSELAACQISQKRAEALKITSLAPDAKIECNKRQADAHPSLVKRSPGRGSLQSLFVFDQRN
jgi:hypothetical protein